MENHSIRLAKYYITEIFAREKLSFNTLHIEREKKKKT